MISNNNYLKCPKNQLFWQQLNEETKPYFVKTICIAFNLSRYLIFDTSYHWRNISKVEYENKFFFGRHLPTLVRAEQIVVSFVVKKWQHGFHDILSAKLYNMIIEIMFSCSVFFPEISSIAQDHLKRLHFCWHARKLRKQQIEYQQKYRVKSHRNCHVNKNTAKNKVLCCFKPFFHTIKKGMKKKLEGIEK